jgi:hypothetical protein
MKSLLLRIAAVNMTAQIAPHSFPPPALIPDSPCQADSGGGYNHGNAHEDMHGTPPH